MNPPSESAEATHFDVRHIPCRIKHGQIFQRWTDLPVGSFFILVNDHDPLPLYHQFAAQFPGAFRWEYLQRGPEEFHVRITRLAPSRTAAAAPARAAVPFDASKVFDVRPIPGRVKHAAIFQTWLDLAVGDYFVLLNDHDPIPLRYQFEAEFPGAFTWEYVEQGPDEFRVKITKLVDVFAAEEIDRARAAANPAPTPRAQTASPANRSTQGEQHIDARGLEPPEPLIRILDALESLPGGVRLRAITDREPCHLFGEATQRGFRYVCSEQPDHSWITILERN